LKNQRELVKQKETVCVSEFYTDCIIIVRDKKMKKRKKTHQTQWAGQFGVAHELTRRGYLVAFTTGNAPAADLLCESPSGVAFSVQVKSLSSKTYFLYQKSLLEPNASLFFVFVLVPPDPSCRPEYFVLNNQQFQDIVNKQENLLSEAEKKRGKPYAEFSPGINYGTLAQHKFLDAWGNLQQ